MPARRAVKAPTAAVPFTGIPAEAFDFYDALAADNSKAFWEAHKADYVAQVRGPLQALVDGLAAEFGPAHLYRPYRDVRFSKDKTPYKDHQGAFVEAQDAVGYYVQVSGAGLMVAAGWYAPQGRQIVRYREAVDSPAGAVLEQVVASLRRKAGVTVEGDVMKTRPQGVAADHPRLELLRHRSMVAMQRWDPEPWMGTKRAQAKVRDAWRATRPLVEWLSQHVGPADDGADGRQG